MEALHVGAVQLRGVGTSCFTLGFDADEPAGGSENMVEYYPNLTLGMEALHVGASQHALHRPHPAATAFLGQLAFPSPPSVLNERPKDRPQPINFCAI